MTTTINAQTTTGLLTTADGSGVVKLQSAGVTTNSLVWVNFNGSGGASIRSSYNVSSVTRSGAGQYYVSFTNSTSDAKYAALGSASITDGNFGLVPGDEFSTRTTSRTGGFYTVNTTSVNNATDANNINITVHGN